jgi:hypothetical protein
MLKHRAAVRLSLPCAILLCALAAPTATAETKDVFNSDSGSSETFLTGTEVKGINQVFIITEKLTVTCAKATAKGNVSGAQFESFEVHPVYYQEELKCNYSGETSGSTAWVRTQECNYLFQNETDANERAIMEVKCEGGNMIMIEIGMCKIWLDAQPLRGAKYINENPGKPSEKAIKVDIDTEGTEKWTSKNCGGFKIPEKGSAGSKYYIGGEFTFKGYVDLNGKEEEQTGIWVE